MTVSVALATYNGENFVVEQLDSLREQTRRPDEVVIIDDRSTDGTVGIVREYIFKHGLDWRLSVAESNSGYKRNFYNCLKATTGDVVFFAKFAHIDFNQGILTPKYLSCNHPCQFCLAHASWAHK